jgi:hypothetical protein
MQLYFLRRRIPLLPRSKNIRSSNIRSLKEKVQAAASFEIDVAAFLLGVFEF